MGAYAADLSTSEIETLKTIAAMIVPADRALGLPGADDATIYSDILSEAKHRSSAISLALQQLDQVAGQAFSDLTAAEQQTATETFQEQYPEAALQLSTLTVQCYYRDARVMRQLGMAVQPPFPEGYTVAQGDWSLLGPVQQRSKMYRE